MSFNKYKRKSYRIEMVAFYAKNPLKSLYEIKNV